MHCCKWNKRYYRGSSQGLPLFVGRGTIFVELLVVIAIFSIISGSLLFSIKYPSISRLKEVGARREAERLALWLESRIVRAHFLQEDFSIRILPEHIPIDIVRVKWKSIKLEKYEAHGDAWFYVSGRSTLYRYNPYWHTLSPALVLNVLSAPYGGKAICRIVISPHCRVSIKDGM